MKKKTITCLLIGTMLGLTACGNNISAETVSTDIQTMEMEANTEQTETISQTTGEETSETTESSETQENEDIIEEKNLLLKEITHYGDDSSAITEYEYDNGNVQTGINYYSYDADENILLKVEQEYDSNGFPIKIWSISYYGGEESEETYIYQNEYNDGGDLIKCIGYDANETLIKWVEYEYDTNGNEIKEISYDDDEVISNWLEYEYDTNGNKVKETFYDSDGSIFMWTEYEYDSDGNEVKETPYDSSGTYGTSEYMYEYDTNGNKVKKTFYNSDGSINYWTEYIYK